MSDIRYEPEEQCPPLVAAASAAQMFLPNTIGVIMLATLVVQTAGESDGYLGWVIFTALVVTGASMVLHTLRLRYLGSGRLVVSNFNVPFLALSAVALHAGGPGLLGSLIVASTLVQFVLTLRLASLRRVFTPTVSGVVVMLVAVSAVPYIVSSTVVVPEGTAAATFLAPGMAALGAGVIISLQGSAGWRMWVLPVMVAVGLLVAAPLGFYDGGAVAAAPWLSLPDFGWPGLDLSFGADFWALLPVFVIVNLTAFMKTLGDLSVIYRASYRDAPSIDHRVVQGGLSVSGLGVLCSGLLGTLPVAAPWAATVGYISFTRVAAKSAGLYLGLLTIAVAPFSKFLAVLVAIPSPVVSAVYVVIFGMLFVEGAKTVFGPPRRHGAGQGGASSSGYLSEKNATLIGVSMVLGLSAGIFSGLVEGVTSQLVGNTIVVGGLAAMGMTLLTEFPNLRSRKLRVELSEASLPAVDAFVSAFADRHPAWTEEGKHRLRLVGEEALLSLLSLEAAPEAGASAPAKRQLVLTIRSEGASAEIEILVGADDAIGGNIEDRLAYMGDDVRPEDEQEASARILRHYASAVNHWKYYGVDVISCRVER